ncbi:MAG: hypothetical protein EBR89_05075 [Betaproteobacteria bacterium]|nr:hypothetical protein [Betaproteobacteria bacterium]
MTVTAGDLAREPVRLKTALSRAACTTVRGSVRLSPDIALGLVAFNSPYLFGGKALRSQLTCGACHAKEGPSGAAVRLRLRAPVPDLALLGSEIDVAAFVSRAVEYEFDGPPLPARTARALSALTRALAPYADPEANPCEVDGASLVAIGLRLCAAQAAAAHPDAEELAFVRDSLRFVLGELAESTSYEAPAALIERTNRALRAADLHGLGCGTPAHLLQLATRWDAAGHGRHFVVEYSRRGIRE